MSTVAVFGATGYAGGHITAELASRGHRVVGIARDVSSLEGSDTVNPKTGDLFDTAFVEGILADVDAVVVALRAHTDPPLLDAIDPLLAALDGRGVRLGVVGGAASLLTKPGGPRVFDDGFPEAAKGEAGGQIRVLDALKASRADVDWFYVSPAKSFGSFNPGERTGRYRLGDDVAVTDENGDSFISGADYAIAFVDEIEKPAHHRARFTVGY